MTWRYSGFGNAQQPPKGPDGFEPGREAYIKGSFEVVPIIAVEGDNVLVKRANGQWTYHKDQLVPYTDDVCLIN